MSDKRVLKNGVWVHELEWESLSNLVEVCKLAVDAKTPSTVEWQLVREALYNVKASSLDVDLEDRIIKSLVRIEEELDRPAEDSYGWRDELG